MAVALQIVSLILMLFAGIAIGTNWLGVFRYFITGQRYSLIPFVGGLMGALALCVCPFEIPRLPWWIPLLADLGCVPLLIATVFDQLIRRLHKP